MKSLFKHLAATAATFALVITPVVATPASVKAQATQPVLETTATIQRAPVIQPEFLIVPGLEAATIVEQVGVNQEGNMDVPDDWRNSAWYSPGYAPGENGHAVFAAHRDWSGNAGPFFDLGNLENGDMIYTANSEGTILAYEVDDSILYGRLDRPQGAVFGAAINPSISLITCEGNYLESDETYTDRRVVQGELAFSVENGQITFYR